MEQILNNIGMVSLNISLWQGRKTLSANDLATNGIDVSKLPPGSLASLGSKKTISPDALKKFVACKREATTLCLKYGVRFGAGGYAVPSEKMAEICSRLGAIKDEFAVEKDIFLDNYAAHVQEWIAQAPAEWRDAIKNSVDSMATVRSMLSFNFSAFRVNVPDDGLANGIEEEVNSLYGQLCKEIRTAAKIAYQSSFEGKTEVGPKALRPIINMREKLKGMLFLDPAIQNTIDEINVAMNAFDGIKRVGLITGSDVNMLSGLLANKLSHMGIANENQSTEEQDDIDGETLNIIIPAPAVEAVNWDF